MAISADDTQISVEFVYQPDERPDEQYAVKYHHVDGLPTVSVSTDREEWVQLPADLVMEVTDFLRSQRILEPQSQSLNVAPSPGTLVQSNKYPLLKSSSKMGEKLTLPDLGGGSVGIEVDASNGPEPMEVADVNPLQSFTNLGQLGERVSKGPKKKKVDEEIISRPVIRGASEEESRLIRSGNEEKVIKRK